MSRKTMWLVIVSCLLIPSVSQGEIIITVGLHDLLPNTANQPVPIFVDSTDPINDPLVTGFNLEAQIGDGLNLQSEPVFTGTPGSRDGVDFVVGTFWTGAITVSGEAPVLTAPQFAEAGVSFQDPYRQVAPDGLLATLFVSTVGFDSGSFPLLLSGTQTGLDSNFILIEGNEFFPTIQNGSITVVPEPTSLLLLLFASAGLLMARRQVDVRRLSRSASPDEA